MSLNSLKKRGAISQRSLYRLVTKVQCRRSICKPRLSARPQFLAHLLLRLISFRGFLQGPQSESTWAVCWRVVLGWALSCERASLSFPQMWRAHAHTQGSSEPSPEDARSPHFAMCLIKCQRGVPFVMTQIEKMRVQFSMWLLLASGRCGVPQGPGNHAFLQDPR